MNRSDLLLKKRNAPEKRQKQGCCGSTELPIVVATRSWREISCEKLGILIQQTKNSLNFVSTCLKVVDTRRSMATVLPRKSRKHSRTFRSSCSQLIPVPKFPDFRTPWVRRDSSARTDLARYYWP